MSTDIMALSWLGLGAFLMLLEIVLPGLVVVFLGFGALIVALAVYLGWVAGWINAGTLFFVASLGSLLLLRGMFQRMMPGQVETGDTDDDTIGVGVEVEVIEDVGPGEDEGRIRYGGTTWRATSYDKLIPAGEKAKLVVREGQVWLIETLD
ncbi:MAG: NfeD family protein [Deltaproteobacteria bacterium]|nr:NfeD family protein [Deltaproteobacteria bacterium]